MRKAEITYTYYCDHCDKDLGDREHILIEDASRLGWVGAPEWLVPESCDKRRTYQFCDLECLMEFINESKM